MSSTGSVRTPALPFDVGLITYLFEVKFASKLRRAELANDPSRYAQFLRLYSQKFQHERLALARENLSVDTAAFLAQYLLKETYFTSWDLRGNQFGSAGAVHFARALHDRPAAFASLHLLDLSDCGIHSDGVIALAQALEHNSCVHTLHLSNTDSGAKNFPRETGALALCRWLTSASCTLQELRIDNIGAEAAAVIMTSGIPQCTSLKRLFARRNDMGQYLSPTKFRAMFDAFARSDGSSTIEELHLSNNQLLDGTAAKLWTVVAHCPQLTILDLRTNKVGKLFCDEWLSHVSDRNSMSLNHLRELWLDNNTNVDLVSLSFALRTQTSFSEFRASQRCHLHTLSLSRCGLGDVTPLARVLSTMSTHSSNPNLGFHLTRIDLSGNGVGDEGGRSIFLALTQASASPSHIDMSECKIGDQTAKVAAGFISKSKSIVSIKLVDNQINDCDDLLHAITSHPSLLELDLFLNPGAPLIDRHLQSTLRENARRHQQKKDARNDEEWNALEQARNIDMEGQDEEAEGRLDSHEAEVQDESVSDTASEYSDESDDSEAPPPMNSNPNVDYETIRLQLLEEEREVDARIFCMQQVYLRAQDTLANRIKIATEGKANKLKDLRSDSVVIDALMHEEETLDKQHNHLRADLQTLQQDQRKLKDLLQLEHDQSEALHARIKADYLNGMNRFLLLSAAQRAHHAQQLEELGDLPESEQERRTRYPNDSNELFDMQAFVRWFFPGVDPLHYMVRSAAIITDDSISSIAQLPHPLTATAPLSRARIFGQSDLNTLKIPYDFDSAIAAPDTEQFSLDSASQTVPSDVCPITFRVLVTDRSPDDDTKILPHVSVGLISAAFEQDKLSKQGNVDKPSTKLDSETVILIQLVSDVRLQFQPRTGSRSDARLTRVQLKLTLSGASLAQTAAESIGVSVDDVIALFVLRPSPALRALMQPPPVVSKPVIAEEPSFLDSGRVAEVVTEVLHRRGSLVAQQLNRRPSIAQLNRRPSIAQFNRRSSIAQFDLQSILGSTSTSDSDPLEQSSGLGGSKSGAQSTFKANLMASPSKFAQNSLPSFGPDADIADSFSEMSESKALSPNQSSSNKYSASTSGASKSADEVEQPFDLREYPLYYRLLNADALRFLNDTNARGTGRDPLQLLPTQRAVLEINKDTDFHPEIPFSKIVANRAPFTIRSWSRLVNLSGNHDDD